LKKCLESESEGDFSPDEDDFNPDESSSSSEDSSDDDRDQENITPPKKLLPVASRVLKTPSTSLMSATPSTRRSARNKSDFNYVLQSDDYFTSAAYKTKTSNHTLDRLKNPRLPHDQLVKLLTNMQLSKDHQRAVKTMNKEYKSFFGKWLTLFDEGYTVLLHGLGSKRNLLQSFHKEMLAEEHVIVVNGFFPSLTIKDIIDTIWVDILEKTAIGGNLHELVNLIDDELKLIPALHIFLIIHNIDGPMLRNDKTQSILSRLANVKNLHLIASIDHINTPLRK
jgi:origin recognition complex subunit 2